MHGSRMAVACNEGAAGAPVRSLAGDEHGRRFEALWEAHAAAVRSYSLGSCGRADVAEEVVQETFARAWLHLVELEQTVGAPRAWLLTVARNVLIDRSRRQAVRPVLVDGTAAEGVVDGGMDAAVEAAVLAEALARLSPDHRAVLRLGVASGRSVAEVAEALAVPGGTVKSRTFYALRALRVALDELGYER